MSAHTAGCTAATAGIAAAASLLTATIIIDRIDEADVTKNLKKVMHATAPLNLGYVLAGTAAALAQAYKTPATKSLWLSAAGLLAAVVPYTYWIHKDDCCAMCCKKGEAGAEAADKKVPSIKSWSKHGYLRVGLLAASTGVMVYALAKKGK